MREIKFRGKRSDNGEWVYGDLIHFNENLLIRKTSGNLVGVILNVIPETIGQFTGLFDKDGKEVFEGDNYKHPLATEPEEKGFIVVWDGFGFDAVNVNFPENSEYNGFLSQDYISKCQVIGNIHDKN